MSPLLPSLNLHLHSHTKPANIKRAVINSITSRSKPEEKWPASVVLEHMLVSVRVKAVNRETASRSILSRGVCLHLGRWAGGIGGKVRAERPDVPASLGLSRVSPDNAETYVWDCWGVGVKMSVFNEGGLFARWSYSENNIRMCLCGQRQKSASVQTRDIFREHNGYGARENFCTLWSLGWKEAPEITQVLTATHQREVSYSAWPLLHSHPTQQGTNVSAL